MDQDQLPGFALNYGQDQQQAPNFLDALHHIAVAKGYQALQDGQIDPKDAAKTAQKLGVGDPNELKAIISGKHDYDYTFGGAKHAPPPAQTKTTMTKPGAVDQAQVGSNLDMLRATPEYQDVQQGNQGLDTLAKMAPIFAMSQANNAWIQPLAALADYSSGQAGNRGTAVAGASKIPTPVSPAEQAQMMLKYQDEIQKRKEDNFKALLSGLGGLNKQAGKEVIQIGGTQGGMNSQESRDERFHNEVLRKIDNNPTLQKQFSALSGLDNSIELLTGQNGVSVNPALWHEAMQTMRLNTVGAGRSVGDERADAYMESLAKKWEAYFGEKMANGVASIPQNDPQLIQAKNELNAARNMIQKQRGNLLNQVTSGHGSIYARRPDLKEDLADKISAFNAAVPAKSPEPIKIRVKDKASGKLGYWSPDKAGEQLDTSKYEEVK